MWRDFESGMKLHDLTSGGAGQRASPRLRDFSTTASPHVKEFYRLNHRYQTVDFVRAKHAQYLGLDHHRMDVWEAIERLDDLVDESDPDTELSQLQHGLQTAEAIRAGGHPPWFIVTGLIHDLGKVLCLFDEPQWAVVGDTFPVGCEFSEAIVFSELFDANPDRGREEYASPTGMYHGGCGLDRVLMSWGHDEYLYHVVKERLPEEALYMIRYHSFYAAHAEGAYTQLMNERDRNMFAWVRTFSAYDLYSKVNEPADVKALRPYYRDLVAEFFSTSLNW